MRAASRSCPVAMRKAGTSRASCASASRWACDAVASVSNTFGSNSRACRRARAARRRCRADSRSPETPTRVRCSRARCAHRARRRAPRASVSPAASPAHAARRARGSSRPSRRIRRSRRETRTLIGRSNRGTRCRRRGSRSHHGRARRRASTCRNRFPRNQHAGTVMCDARRCGAQSGRGASRARAASP